MDHFNEKDAKLMKRCLQLASFGSNQVGTNPMVGAVITFNDRIIGEGYHKKSGGNHAEIEALLNVKKADLHLLGKSHMYVSLEPCNHHGKTPPCVDAILRAGIPEITICNVDPNPLMKGKSIEMLKSSRIKVRQGLLKEPGAKLNRKFFALHKDEIPFVILKWAQSKDCFLGQEGKQVWLTNEQTRLFTHKWREGIDAIMVGTNTAIVDDPLLTNRRSQGKSPHRFVLDRKARIPSTIQLLKDSDPTTIFSTLTKYPVDHKLKKMITVKDEDWSLKFILKQIFNEGHRSIMIEGGSSLLNSFIRGGLWHEARIIHSPLILGTGIKAPYIKGKIINKYELQKDKLFIISNLYNMNLSLSN